MNNTHDTSQLKIAETIGKDLNQESIDFMVKNRIREYGKNTKDFENNERDSFFFFLKNGDIIKAFGMLKPVTFYCEDKQYQIMGIGNIMAVEKSKGYGTILMNYIRDYLEDNNYVGIGSTHSYAFDFYEKCGFTFVASLLEKVVYIDENDKEHRRTRDSEEWKHAMFIFGKDNQLEELIDGDEDIVIKVPFW